MKDFEKHIMEYLGLFVGELLLMLALIYFKNNHFWQILIIFMNSAFYFIWGIMHHKLEGRLTRLIFLEYFLFACFVFLLLFTAINL